MLSLNKFRFFLLTVFALSWSSLLHAQQSYSYLALGDSYTIGESVEEDERWPNQLVSALNQHQLLNDSLVTIARTGWRTDQMLSTAQQKISSTQKFDLVSLLIGVNNEFQGRSPASFKSEFEKCLTFAIEHCKHGKNGVIVLSIPDYGYTPFGKKNKALISKRIDAYNAICKSYCKKYGVPFFDITSLSRNGLKKAELVAKDGLHPSASQYTAWVKSIEADVVKIAKKWH